MRKIILILLLSCAPLGAQAPLRAVWDYPIADMSGITRFEAKLDSATSYSNIGIPQPETLPSTPAGMFSYSWLLPDIGNGTHTLFVRACTSSECSFDAVVSFRQVGPPNNPRIER